MMVAKLLFRTGQTPRNRQRNRHSELVLESRSHGADGLSTDCAGPHVAWQHAEAHSTDRCIIAIVIQLAART
jgi:hypothetical protein